MTESSRTAIDFPGFPGRLGLVSCCLDVEARFRFLGSVMTGRTVLGVDCAAKASIDFRTILGTFSFGGDAWALLLLLT